MKTTIIIPTYNEKENIGKLINKILSISKDFYILVIDDNSPDRTGSVVKNIAGKESRVEVFIRQGKRGFGPSYIDGFKKVLGGDSDYIVQMDADFSHDPAEIKNLISYLNKYDFVIGSRYINKGIRIVNWPLWRLFLSSFAGFYTRFFTGLPISDPTSGFGAWRKEALQKISFEEIKTNGYSFLIEMKYRAWKKGLRFKEVPIVFTDRRFGASKMSKKNILEAVLSVIKLKLSK